MLPVDSAVVTAMLSAFRQRTQPTDSSSASHISAAAAAAAAAAACICRCVNTLHSAHPCEPQALPSHHCQAPQSDTVTWPHAAAQSARSATPRCDTKYTRSFMADMIAVVLRQGQVGKDRLDAGPNSCCAASSATAVLHDGLRKTGRTTYMTSAFVY
jgi:hypothetical protein